VHTDGPSSAPCKAKTIGSAVAVAVENQTDQFALRIDDGATRVASSDRG
jgi:hypothetical protein